MDRRRYVILSEESFKFKQLLETELHKHGGSGSFCSWQEPDVTAALTFAFPHLTSFYQLSGNIQLGSSYIHQRPYVEFWDRQSCEAGDVLLLCKFIKNGISSYRATLVQIKKMNGDYFSDKTSVQYRFYTQWPQFHFKYSPTCEYDITPKKVGYRGLYGIVCNQGQLFSYSLPSERMVYEANQTMYQLIMGLANNEWKDCEISNPDKKEKDQWSAFVWELVNRNRDAMFKRRRIDISADSRNQMSKFFELLLQSNQNEAISDCIDERAITIWYIEVKGDF